MINIIASNVTGLGASQLVLSLLPKLEQFGAIKIGIIWLPDRGLLARFSSTSHTRVDIYHRSLPNFLSRFIESNLIADRIYGRSDSLVLGDMPLKKQGRQIVFIQNTFLIPGTPDQSVINYIRNKLLRANFRKNLKYADQIIVQTEVMADNLVRHYPQLRDRISIVRQPPPAWVMAELCPGEDFQSFSGKLKLFYPSAGYAHKNHILLQHALQSGECQDIVDEIVVTLSREEYQNLSSPIRTVGRLNDEDMIKAYKQTDALLFPSLTESYGLPLVEAMFLGLPIVCADLPYARTLCGDEAIYFDPRSTESLREALRVLHDRLSDGWQVDWSDALKLFPKDWDEVAAAMLRV